MANNSSKYVVREQHGETLLDHLLFHRGVHTAEEKQAFLSPNYEKGVHDPFLLKDMQKVVDRVSKAIESGERIAIYADYDADGVPGGSLFHAFFTKISYTNVIFYIPHRHTEGFGLHKGALDKLASDGAKIVITVDCGITDVEEAKHAKELGIDLIITDHHLTGTELPDAFAIIDPKQLDCQYPEKMLCGSGVAFKVICALIIDNKKNHANSWNISEGWEKWLLDLVGIATLSDMVPLTGENRVFAHYGLKVLRKSPRLGLMKLFRSLKMNQADLIEDDIAFMVTPRINAASRMADPMDAFKLLTAQTDEEADAAVTFLNKVNDDRKVMVAGLLKEIKKSISKKHDGENGKKDGGSVLVVGNPNWRPALLGLVATGLVRDYNKPVFLWGRAEDGILKGSCRSDGVANLVTIMQNMPSEIFIDRGGHSQSGGFSLADDQIHRFEEEACMAYDRCYGDVAKNETSEEQITNEENIIDSKLIADQIGWDTWRAIENLAPFGVSNKKPLFLLENISILGVKWFGKTGDHLEVSFIGGNGKKIAAIKFFAEKEGKLNDLAAGQIISLVCNLEKSMFRSFPELRLRIVEVL